MEFIEEIKKGFVEFERGGGGLLNDIVYFCFMILGFGFNCWEYDKVELKV